MPHCPEMMFFQKVCKSLPNGVTTPMPVTATRRSDELVAINEKGSLSLSAKLP
jgi:hypothetical protein